MLVYTGILSPAALAIPAVGQEHAKAYEHFSHAVNALAHALNEAACDTLLLVAPQEHSYPTSMGLSVHAPYITSLASIGYYEQGISIAPNLSYISALQHILERSPFHITTDTAPTVDFTPSSCLALLAAHDALPASLVLLTPPRDALSLLFSYGTALRESAEERPERVAILFSCFLSHRHNELSPGGAHPRAAAFDTLLQQSLIDGNSTPLLRMALEEAQEVGGVDALNCFRMAAGVLNEWRSEPLWHGHDMVFGIGNTAISFTKRLS